MNDQNNVPTIPAPPPVDEDDEPTIPMKRAELSIWLQVCSVATRCLIVALFAWGTAATMGCSQEVSSPGFVRTYEVTGYFSGSQAVQAATCEQLHYGPVIGGWCRVSPGGTLVRDSMFQSDGWMCVANLDEGKMVEMTIHVECEAPR